MSQPIRSRASAQEARRRRRRMQIEPILRLEAKALLAPYLPIGTRTAEFNPFDDQPENENFGSVTVTFGEASLVNSAAAYVSVSQLTPISTFNDDIVRIEAGPGGDFGKSVYAITRGNGIVGDAGGRPGVIYRVDPATGDGNVFFDLNTVLDQVSPGTTAGNSAGSATGLVNWYDITFDENGVFDGLPSMFVSSVDTDNPLKNAVYRIAPDGTFLGLFVVYGDADGTGSLEQHPSAIHVPPPEQQNFLRGLIAGSGTNNNNQGGFTAGTTNFTGLFFDANIVQGAQLIDAAPFPRRGLAARPDARPAGRPDLGQLGLRLDELRRLHRLRRPHPAGLQPGRPRPQRHPGDLRGHPDPEHLRRRQPGLQLRRLRHRPAARGSGRSGQRPGRRHAALGDRPALDRRHSLPSLPGHHLRPLRLLLLRHHGHAQ